MKVNIRWMIRGDKAEVLNIEHHSFEFPWSEEDFIRCLRHRNCIGMVAEHGDRVVGFMVYELHKRRIHVLNFAVAPECRGRGVGRQMLEKLLGKLVKTGMADRVAITLEIRESNLAAQLFFASHGFRATEVLRGWYEDSDEDAYLFRYRIQVPDSGTCQPQRGAK